MFVKNHIVFIENAINTVLGNILAVISSLEVNSLKKEQNMMWLTSQKVLNGLSSGIDAIAVVIIAFGVLYSIIRYFCGIFGIKKCISIDIMRVDLGRSIVLGVEYLLAADIIRTLIAPDYYSIGLLASLVVIRTVLTYFLNMELHSLAEQE